EQRKKRERELIQALRDEWNMFASDKDELTRKRDIIARQTSQTEQRRTYKELILEVKQYWPDADVYPPEDLIPLDELPMIVDTFVEKVVLDILSPHFYQLMIYWRDPVWGVNTLVCYRGGQPAISWTDEENSILRLYYPTTTRDEIMRLLPERTYNAIQSRASYFRIPKRRTFNTENMPYTLSLSDYEVMATIGNVTEEDLNGERFVEIAGAKLVKLSTQITI
ncbi:MAG: hypothetical protein ACXVDN_19770, partial [Ktedonobacteraceae bacterium]